MADGGSMPLVEHLRELRNRLGISLLALAVCVVAALLLREQVFDVLKQPYCSTRQGAEDCTLFAFGPFEQLAVSLRIALLAGAITSAPVWLYQLGAFITPALHRNERRYAGSFAAAALLLFTAGTLFAFSVISRGLEFLLGFGGESIETLPSIQSYLSFVTLTLLAFGVAFQFPVLVMFLHLVGSLPVARMRAWRRGTVVGIAVAAALLTPSQDPFTFLALALPLYGLYEVCIVLARVRERAVRRRRALRPGARELEDLPDDAPSTLERQPTPL